MKNDKLNNDKNPEVEDIKNAIKWSLGVGAIGLAAGVLYNQLRLQQQINTMGDDQLTLFRNQVLLQNKISDITSKILDQ